MPLANTLGIAQEENGNMHHSETSGIWRLFILFLPRIFSYFNLSQKYENITEI
jgi:hypothetical protein